MGNQQPGSDDKKMAGNATNLQNGSLFNNSNSQQRATNANSSNNPMRAPAPVSQQQQQPLVTLKDEDDKQNARYEEFMRQKLKTARGTRPTEERESAACLAQDKMQQRIQLNCKLALDELKKCRGGVAPPPAQQQTAARTGAAVNTAPASKTATSAMRAGQATRPITTSTNSTTTNSSSRQQSYNNDAAATNQPAKVLLVSDDKAVGPAPAVPSAPVGRVKFASSGIPGGKSPSPEPASAAGVAANRKSRDDVYSTAGGDGSANIMEDSGVAALNASTTTTAAASSGLATAKVRSSRPVFGRQKSQHNKQSPDSPTAEHQQKQRPLKSACRTTKQQTTRKQQKDVEERDEDMDDDNEDDVECLRDPFHNQPHPSSLARSSQHKTSPADQNNSMQQQRLAATNRISPRKASPPPPVQPLQRAAVAVVPAHESSSEEQRRQRKISLAEKRSDELGSVLIANNAPTFTGQKGPDVYIKTGLKTMPTKRISEAESLATTNAAAADKSSSTAKTVTASMMPPPLTPTATTAKPSASFNSERRDSAATQMLARHLSQLDLNTIERITNSSDALMPASARKAKEGDSTFYSGGGGYIPPYIASPGISAGGQRRDSVMSTTSISSTTTRRAHSFTDLTVVGRTAADGGGVGADGVQLVAPILVAPLASCVDAAATQSAGTIAAAGDMDSTTTVVGSAQPMLIPSACVKSVVKREDFARDLVEIIGGAGAAAVGGRNSRLGRDSLEKAAGDTADTPSYKCKLINLLWLELCSWRHGLTIAEQEAFLLEGRHDASLFFKEFAALQTLITERDCTCNISGGAGVSAAAVAANTNAYYNSQMCDMDEDYLYCLTQTYIRIQDVLLRVSQTEQLYPTAKSLEKDIEEAADIDVQSRLQALYMWRNMYYELSVQLDALADIVGVSKKHVALFPKLSRTLQRSRALQMLTRGLSMNTDAAVDSGISLSNADEFIYASKQRVGPCRFHHFSQYQNYHKAVAAAAAAATTAAAASTANADVLSNAAALATAARRIAEQQQSVMTDDSGTGGCTSQSINMSLGGGGSSSIDSNAAASVNRQLQLQTRMNAASVNSPMHTIYSSVGSDTNAGTPAMSYAGIVDVSMTMPRSVEHANLVAILRHYLIRNLRTGITSITEKFNQRLSRMLSMRLDELRSTAPNGTTYRTIMKRMRLPSLEPVLFFLIRFPLHMLEEVMLIRQSQRPSSTLEYTSLIQLQSETKEVLSFGSSTRRAFVEQASKLAAASSAAGSKTLIEVTLDRFDDIFHSTINLYLDYLTDAVMSAHRSAQRFNTQQKELLEVQWKFVWTKLNDLDESNYMLPKAFCEISQQNFALITAFVKLSIEDFCSTLKMTCEEAAATATAAAEAASAAADAEAVAAAAADAEAASNDAGPAVADEGDGVAEQETADNEEEVEEDGEDEDEEEGEDGDEEGDEDDDNEDDEDADNSTKDPQQIEGETKRDAFRVFIRSCKRLCKQSTERAQGALKFAKVLRKDLEIGTVYERTTTLTLEKLMNVLATTGHSRIAFSKAVDAADSNTDVATTDGALLGGRRGSAHFAVDDLSISASKLLRPNLSSGNLATTTMDLATALTSSNTSLEKFAAGNSSGSDLAAAAAATATVEVTAPLAADFSHTMFFVPNNIAQNTELVKLLMNTPIGTSLHDGLDNGYLLIVSVNEIRLASLPPSMPSPAAVAASAPSAEQRLETRNTLRKQQKAAATTSDEGGRKHADSNRTSDGENDDEEENDEMISALPAARPRSGSNTASVMAARGGHHHHHHHNQPSSSSTGPKSKVFDLHVSDREAEEIANKVGDANSTGMSSTTSSNINNNNKGQSLSASAEMSRAMANAMSTAATTSVSIGAGGVVPSVGGMRRCLSGEAPAAMISNNTKSAGSSNDDLSSVDDAVKNSMTRFSGTRRGSQMSTTSGTGGGGAGAGAGAGRTAMIGARLTQQVEWHGETLTMPESIDSGNYAVLRNAVHVREREVLLVVLRNSELFLKRRDFERTILGQLALEQQTSSQLSLQLQPAETSNQISIVCKSLQTPCYTRIFSVLQRVKFEAVELGQTLLAAFKCVEDETLRIDELGMGNILASLSDAASGAHHFHSSRGSQSSRTQQQTPMTPLTPSGRTSTTLQSSARTLLVYVYDRLMEYARELVRLFSKSESAAISILVVDVARAWVQFVMARCPPGRLGIRPRWAHTGLEFLQLASQPTHTCHINDEDFDSLQDMMRQCVSHIVGEAPASGDEEDDDEDEADELGMDDDFAARRRHRRLFSPSGRPMLTTSGKQQQQLMWKTDKPEAAALLVPPTPAAVDSIPSKLHEAEVERAIRERADNAPAAPSMAFNSLLPPGMAAAASASVHAAPPAFERQIGLDRDGSNTSMSPVPPPVKAAPKRYLSNIDDYLTGNAGGMFQLVDDDDEKGEFMLPDQVAMSAAAGAAAASLVKSGGGGRLAHFDTMPAHPRGDDGDIAGGDRSASPEALEIVSKSLNIENGTFGSNGVTMPLLRYRVACSKQEKKRNDKLQREKRIGRLVAAGKVDTTKHLRSRRVNFRWQRGEMIGQGKFGKVFQAVNLDEGKTIAVKLFQEASGPQAKQFTELMKAIDREMTALEGLNQENIIKYLGVEVHRDEICIFMEWCGGGDLAQASRAGLPLRFVRVYTAQILRGIQYLHDNKILHLDMKGENILLTADGELVKICDFNTAIKLRSSMTMTADVPDVPVGTPAFMAPEMINRTTTPGRGADIWSIGCCVVQMLTGKPPFYDMQNSFQVMYAIGSGKHPKIPETTPKDGKDFLLNCFTASPVNRPMASDLLHYKFVAGV